MVEITSLFAGILSRSSSTVLNIGASMWVMDPAVQTVANSIPLPDSALDEVRSIPQVADGLRALDHDATALRAEDEAQRTAKDALHLIHIDYQAGIATYLDVLSADSQYHQTMINDLQATAVRYQDTVALYVALGGGWWSKDSERPTSSVPRVSTPE